MKDQLIEALADIREEEALTLARQMLEAGEDPQAVLDASREAMGIVGDRYDQGEYFLPQLVIAGDMLTEIADMVKPRIEDRDVTTEPLGTIIIGTVAGDIHDIGKDIVAFMLDANSFEVHNLGVDVAAQTFVEKIGEVNPEIVGLSGFLTLAYDSMRKTVEAIVEAGLRDKVKIMVGGAPMNEGVREYIGADAYGPNATTAVRLAKEWLGVE
jgi:5-methyltetrahydrofolate--homocysteine methyltransferase